MDSRQRAVRTAVTNVRVFDGRQLLPLGTVVIEGSRIGASGVADEVIDGAGGVLMPGLIDAHVHLHDRHTLELLSGFGVTTALDMACAPPELVESLRSVPGLTDIRSAGTPAVAPGSLHSRIPVTGQRGLIAGAGSGGAVRGRPDRRGLGLHQDHCREPRPQPRPGHPRRADRRGPGAQQAHRGPCLVL